MFKFKLANGEVLQITKAQLAEVDAFKQGVSSKLKQTVYAADKPAVFERFIFIDGTRFGLFKSGSKYLLQIEPGIRKVQQRIETIEQACEFIRDDAWCFGCHYIYLDGFYNRKFSAMADYLDSDLRVCLEVDCCRHCTYLEVQELSGYDAKEHAWREPGSRYKTRIETKRGQKLLLDLQYAIFDERSSHASNGHRQKYSAHRKDGKFLIY